MTAARKTSPGWDAHEDGPAIPMPDHPRVRASCLCPLCGGVKDQRLVTCWRCYRAFDLRNGNREADRLIAAAELALADAAALAVRQQRDGARR